MFNFDNEIVIGVTKLPDNKKVKSKKILKSNKKKKTINKKIKEKDLKEDNDERIIFFIKTIVSITIIIGIILFLLASPLFEILEINVEGNNVLTKEEAMELSRNKCW